MTAFKNMPEQADALITSGKTDGEPILSRQQPPADDFVFNDPGNVA